VGGPCRPSPFGLVDPAWHSCRDGLGGSGPERPTQTPACRRPRGRSAAGVPAR
jgi:hypothetical protein